MFNYKKELKDLRAAQKRERECLEVIRGLLAAITVPKDWDILASKTVLKFRLYSFLSKKGMMATVEFRALCDQIESVTGEQFKKKASTSDLEYLEAQMSYHGVFIDVTTFDVSGCTITYKEEPVEAQEATVKKVPIFAPECLAAAGIEAEK